MVDTARGGFPAEMYRAAHPEDRGYLETMAEDVADSVAHFIEEKPVTAALWALGIGFVLGWRLKPW